MPHTIGSASTKSREEIGAVATGVLVRNGHPMSMASAGTAPATQVVYGALLGLRAGDVVTGVQLYITTAAAGTSPTTGRAGIADATGKILALSGNVNAAASWPVGGVGLAFASTYTAPAEAGYYACFVVNGVWGTTQPTPVRAGQTWGAGTYAFGTAAPFSFAWTGQTDLPSVGSSLTITSVQSAVDYYLAFY